MDFYGVAIFWTRVDEELGFMQSSSGPWSRKPSPSIATHRIVGPRPGSESAVRFEGKFVDCWLNSPMSTV
jgi:hypothetical protein